MDVKELTVGSPENLGHVHMEKLIPVGEKTFRLAK